MDISSMAGCTLVSCRSQRLATVSSGEKSTYRKRVNIATDKMGYPHNIFLISQ